MIDPADLLRRLAARRAPAADLDPLGLTADEAMLRADALRSSLPRAEMVLPGTPDTDPLGLASSGAGADDPLGLALPADPGPRAPSPMSGSGFALNAPEQPLSASGRLTARQATRRGQGPSGLERVANILEGISAGATGRVPGFERRAAQAKQEARQAEADRLGKLKLLAEAADKAVETPELADFLGRIAQQVAGKDFDAEEWQTLTSGKGLALDAADFADEMGDDYAGRFIQAVRPIRKDPAKVETVRKAFVADAKAKALDRLKPEFLRRLRQPEVRAELLNAGDGKALTEAAIVADLSGPESGLKRFEREALTEWVQSDAGRAQLAQLGVTPASVTLKGAEAAATREEKAGSLSQAVRDVLRGAPFGLTDPEKAATPEQIAQATRMVEEGKDKRARELGTARASVQPLPAETAERIASLENMLVQIDEVSALHKDAYTGPVSGRVSGVSESITGNISDEEVEFRAIVRSLQDDLLRAKSGAAITESEYARLVGFLPDVTNPPNVFKSRVRRFKRSLQQLLDAKKRAAGLTRGDVRSGGGVPSGAVREIIGEPEVIE